ncbi:major capsid protein [Synechococcus phage S-SRP02]|nr:major capsid protein [Synechococcus phage S-SRP02]
MANASLDRLGQIKGAGAVDALFLKLGMTELLDAFDRACVFKGKVKERNIRGGKSAAFQVSGKADAAYHVPGTPILGATNSPGDRNERIINLDGLLIADQVIYDLDELMNYVDVRQDVTHQLGQALAREWDKRCARVLYGAAKNVTEPLAKAGNAGRIGQSQTLSAGYAAATANAKGDELIAKISALKVAMQKKDVPTDDLICVVGPDEYDYLLDSTRAINTDFNGASGENGSFASGRVLRVKGIPVIMSNHVTQAAYTNGTYDKNTDYQQDLSKNKAIVFHRDAIGVLTLRSPGLQITPQGGDFNIMYQATLMVARMAIGMGVLRAECAGVIELP